MTAAFIALGCPKNMVDSEKMLAEMGQSGLVLAGDPDHADVVVINTCGFIEPARQEAMQAIRRAVRQKKKGHVGRIIVAGCLSQRLGKDLAAEAPQIDAIIGLNQRDRIGMVIQSLLSEERRAEEYFEAGASDQIHDDRGRLLISPAHWAYLRISEGCDRRCSFCTIPMIRGRFRSKPMEMVLDEARELVENGAVELSLIAQDSNYYGRDLGVKNGLTQLIGELEKLEPLRWIRLMYLYPAGVDDSLIEAMAGSKKVVPYVDMPVQHINDRILRAMHRSDTEEKTRGLIERLRAAMPEAVLRTTLIVGFPGETDEDFEQLMDFVRWARFDALGCFPFYPEPDTPAADMENQVPDAVKQQRLDVVMRAQQTIAFEKNQGHVGRRLDCLVDDIMEDGVGIGRYYGQAPHVDSVCLFERLTAEPGEIVPVEVVAAQDYDLIVRQVGD